MEICLLHTVAPCPRISSTFSHPSMQFTSLQFYYAPSVMHMDVIILIKASHQLLVFPLHLLCLIPWKKTAASYSHSIWYTRKRSWLLLLNQLLPQPKCLILMDNDTDDFKSRLFLTKYARIYYCMSFTLLMP